MLSHQIKDLEGPESKKRATLSTTTKVVKEHISKFFKKGEEADEVEVLRAEEEILGEERLKRAEEERLRKEEEERL